MRLRRTWVLLVGLLLVMGLTGCDDPKEPLDEKAVASKQEPEKKPAVHKPETVVEKTLTEEKAIVAKIKEMGGHVEFDRNKAVVKVRLRDDVTDAGLEHLKGLTNLQDLYLGFSKVTDAGLEHLKGLTSLQGLNLNSTQVTDAGLEHLKGLTNLQDLGFYRTKVTDAGLEHLKGLTNLQNLALDGTKVTDAGLEHLEGMTKLQDLYLIDTNVTDEGVKNLQQALPNCEIYR